MYDVTAGRHDQHPDGEPVSTGKPAPVAAKAAVAGPLTDDPVVTAGLAELIDAYFEDE